MILIGCARYVPPVAEPVAAPSVTRTIELAEQDCFAGDVAACMDAIARHRAGTMTHFDRKRALELSAHACIAGELHACFLAAMDERELGRTEAAHARLLDTCDRGHAPSCEVLRREDFLQALGERVELWRCARFVERVGYGSHVWISGMLKATAAGDAALIELDPNPAQAILQACVRRATETMRFSPTAAPMSFWYKLDLRPEIVAAKLGELEGEGVERLPARPTPATCTPELRQRCASLPIDVLMGNVIYSPQPSGRQIEAAWSSTLSDVSRPLNVSVDFCVEPKTGKTSRMRRADPGPGQPIADLLISAVAKWRFFPLEVDGKQTLACGRIDFEVGQRSDPPSEPEPIDHESAPKPVKVTPARALHNPAPSRKLLRNTRAARAGHFGQISEITYCIDVQGRVGRVKLRHRGDPGVDRILRDTVESWRFTPLRIDGEPRESCNVQTFRILFD